MKIDRPLDLLNGSKGKEIILKLKNDKLITGTLLSFDININIVLENSKELAVSNEVVTETKLGLMFIRGDNVIYISPA